MLYEVVTGYVLLSKRPEFEKLHKEILLPTYKKCEINIVCCLMTDVGTVGKFIDIYQYKDFQDYDEKTTLLENELNKLNYYPQIQLCIKDSIKIELMKSFNYPI